MLSSVDSCISQKLRKSDWFNNVRKTCHLFIICRLQKFMSLLQFLYSTFLIRNCSSNTWWEYDFQNNDDWIWYTSTENWVLLSQKHPFLGFFFSDSTSSVRIYNLHIRIYHHFKDFNIWHDKYFWIKIYCCTSIKWHRF